MVFMQNFGGRGVPAETCCSECGKPESVSRRMVKTGSVHVAAKYLEQPLSKQCVKTVHAQCTGLNFVEVRGGKQHGLLQEATRSRCDECDRGSTPRGEQYIESTTGSLFVVSRPRVY